MVASPSIHLMAGFPSTGKTTFIRKEMNDFVRICIQDIILMLKKDFDPGLRAIYRKIENDAIISCIEQGKSVVLDRTSLDIKTRARFILLAQRLKVRIDLTYLEVPRFVFLARNSARPANEKVPDNVYDKFQKLFEIPTLDEGFSQIAIRDENFELLEIIN